MRFFSSFASCMGGLFTRQASFVSLPASSEERGPAITDLQWQDMATLMQTKWEGRLPRAMEVADPSPVEYVETATLVESEVSEASNSDEEEEEPAQARRWRGSPETPYCGPMCSWAQGKAYKAGLPARAAPAIPARSVANFTIAAHSMERRCAELRGREPVARAKSALMGL